MNFDIPYYYIMSKSKTKIYYGRKQKEQKS